MFAQANLWIAGSMAGGLNLIYAGVAFGLTEVCSLASPNGQPICAPMPEAWALAAILVGLGLLLCGGIFLVHDDTPEPV